MQRGDVGASWCILHWRDGSLQEQCWGTHTFTVSLWDTGIKEYVVLVVFLCSCHSPFSFSLPVCLFFLSFLWRQLAKKKKINASHVFHLLTRLHARTPPPPPHTHIHVCTHAPSPTPTPHTHTQKLKKGPFTPGGNVMNSLLWDTAFTLCCIYTLLWDTAFTLCCGTLQLHFAAFTLCCGTLHLHFAAFTLYWGTLPFILCCSCGTLHLHFTGGHCIYTLLHLHFTGGHCHLYFAVAVGHCIYTLLWDTAFRLLALGHCISTCLWDAAFTLFCGTMHLHFAVGQCIYMFLSLR